ncbi:HdeD family acid-resistance protein [Amaricoccus sp.]|uniref:HdeD family acid-resistance protein n=1 Tax=Amaricoccus sp. TaxID=1872485 RepID=UPI002611E362|nr:HdeD family acid-resistance protein [Amaricoccus sp.]HRO13435.1 HdeD family acid-resistance protein [Amaricoccus sp.]
MSHALDDLASRPLLRHMAEYWWLVLLRGIAAVVFGLLALFMPAVAGLSLVFLWGAYTLADGIFSLWAGIVGSGASTGSRWWLAITGLLGIAAGLIAFLAPALTAGILLIFIAIWSIAIGAMAIVGAIQLRKEIEGEWFLILSGAIAILFGILMFTRPASAALAVVWMIATFAIIFGIDLILLAFKLKGYKRA